MKTLIGKMVGIVDVEKGPEGNRWTTPTMGIAMQSDNAFKTEEVIEVVVSDKIDSDKFRASVRKLIGQEVQLSITEKHKVWNNNVQTAVYFNEFLPAPNYVSTGA